MEKRQQINALINLAANEMWGALDVFKILIWGGSSSCSACTGIAVLSNPSRAVASWGRGSGDNGRYRGGGDNGILCGEEGWG